MSKRFFDNNGRPTGSQYGDSYYDKHGHPTERKVDSQGNFLEPDGCHYNNNGYYRDGKVYNERNEQTGTYEDDDD